jgi:polysaccharide biosynthesis transport protein
MNSPPTSGAPPPGAYLKAIRHHRRAIAALVLAAVVAGAAFSLWAGKRYDAEAVLSVSPLPSDDPALVSVGVFREAGSGAATSVYALSRLLTTPAVVEGVKERLAMPDATRESVLQDVKVKPAQQSATVSVVASAKTPERAARIANAFVNVILAQRGEAVQRDLRAALARLRARAAASQRDEAAVLRQQIAELDGLVGTGDPTLRLLTAAVPPESASSPSPLVTVIVALVPALLFGVSGAFVLELLAPRLRADDEILDRLPIMADVPRAPARRVKTYMNASGTLPGDLWEAYRVLRASLSGRGVKSVLVTSAVQGEGKTMTSVNLAIALAASGQRVVLVDGDLRRPMVGRVFGVRSESDGFADLLFGESDPEDVLVPAPGYGDQLRLLLAGSNRPLDLLEPGRIKSMLDRLRAESDIIVIDSPALMEFADATALAKAVDAVLIAVRIGRTRRDKLDELRRRLAQQEIEAVGVVVTGRTRSRGDGGKARAERPVEPPSAARGDDQLAAGVASGS